MLDDFDFSSVNPEFLCNKITRQRAGEILKTRGKMIDGIETGELVFIRRILKKYSHINDIHDYEDVLKLIADGDLSEDGNLL